MGPWRRGTIEPRNALHNWEPWSLCWHIKTLSFWWLPLLYWPSLENGRKKRCSKECMNKREEDTRLFFIFCSESGDGGWCLRKKEKKETTLGFLYKRAWDCRVIRPLKSQTIPLSSNPRSFPTPLRSNHCRRYNSPLNLVYFANEDISKSWHVVYKYYKDYKIEKKALISPSKVQKS